jgi:hypothetical protein|tara:strand:+ start:482 stop:2248 length:1767 start_codon:yes stop_codon:yes gene_type:complete
MEMIKEVAFGVSNRGNFQSREEIFDLQGTDTDLFVSLYDYDEAVIAYYAKKGSLSGYDGNIYMPEEFMLDVDGKNIRDARDKLMGLSNILDDCNLYYRIYFSGTGFHVGINKSAFKWEPSPNLHVRVKEELTKVGIYEFADSSVTDKTRIIRLVNTKNTKSGLYKVCIEDNLQILSSEDEIFKRELIKLASNPRNVDYEDIELNNPVFDVRDKEKPKEKPEVKVRSTRDPVATTCIQKMLDGAPHGKRHMVALRIASHLRWNFPENIVRLIMEDWRVRVSQDAQSEFKKEEMDGIVEGCYTGHDGQGYRYGADDPVIKFYCDSKCTLHRGAKAENMMDSSSMEDELINFYAQDLKPLNLGEPYGQDFPVYPGETVIIQAPPASMKTMLLQNWVNYFKRPTYFVEMEMSPRQIWSRFVQIEMGWDEKQLADHYKQMKNGMDKRFEWLTVDYSAPYPHELERRITALPIKPEIVIVDHLGLFKSKQKDNNMKVEEASQAIMELAVRQNVIVFAVSEVSKAAFKEGMDISSSRGSFRIAYNANKLISLKPYKNKETGLVELIDIKSDKNREKEHLFARLVVNNVRIEKGGY